MPGVTVARNVEELGIGANVLCRWRREQAADWTSPGFVDTA
jgi:hypothetical protein